MEYESFDDDWGPMITGPVSIPQPPQGQPAQLPPAQQQTVPMQETTFQAAMPSGQLPPQHQSPMVPMYGVRQPLPAGMIPRHLQPLLPPSMRTPRPPPAMQAMAGDAVENGHTLGMSFLLAGIGTAVGASYAGMLGGVGGGLAGGAVLNLFHAYKHYVKAEDDKEVTTYATWGVLCAVASAYFIYQGHEKKKSKNPSDASPDVVEENLEGVE